MPTEIDFSDEGDVIIARRPGEVNFSDSEGMVIVARHRKQKPTAPIPLPQQNPDAWDTMKVAGVVMPGVVKVDGAGHARRTSTSEAPGLNGAKTTDTGRKARKITVTVTIGWEDDHLERMQKVLKLVFRSGRVPPAMTPSASTTTQNTPPTQDDTLYLPFDTLGPRVYDPAYSTRTDGGLAAGAQGVAVFEPFGVGAMSPTDPSTPGPVGTVASAQLAAKQAAEAKAKVVPKPVDVEHPALRLFGIGSLYFLEVDMKLMDKQVLEFRFSCVDYIPPANRAATVGTAKGSASSASGGWDSIQSAIQVSSPVNNWKP